MAIDRQLPRSHTVQSKGMHTGRDSKNISTRSNNNNLSPHHFSPLARDVLEPYSSSFLTSLSLPLSYESIRSFILASQSTSSSSRCRLPRNAPTPPNSLQRRRSGSPRPWSLLLVAVALSTCLLTPLNGRWPPLLAPGVDAAVKNGYAFRNGNLDYFDSQTLRYYLGLVVDDNAPAAAAVSSSSTAPSPVHELVLSSQPPPVLDYDVVVMYYAQWDQNSHALAPLWDQIATLLHAAGGEDLTLTTSPGSSSSSSSIDPAVRKQKQAQAQAQAKKKASPVIMALFDCEMDYESMVVCNDAGITHYPTIQFLSLTAADHDRVARHVQSRPPRSPKKPQTKATTKSAAKTTTTGPRPPAHVTVFSGNWQYGDAILDWIKALSAMNAYRRADPWPRRLARAVWARLLPTAWWGRPHVDEEDASGRSIHQRSSSSHPRTLPVGIPHAPGKGAPVDPAVLAGRSSLASAGISPTTSSSSGNEDMISETQVKEIISMFDDEISQMQTVLKRSSQLIDSLLFPIHDTNTTLVGDPIPRNHNVTRIVDPVAAAAVSAMTNDSSGNETRLLEWKRYTDVFSYLNVTNGWDMAIQPMTLSSSSPSSDTTFPVPVLVKSCVAELSLDYCQRLSAHHLDNWIRSFPLGESSITDGDITAYVETQGSEIAAWEPYCGMIEQCFVTDFAVVGKDGDHNDTNCRPSHCPFRDGTACRYVSACLSSPLQQEYDTAFQELWKNTNATSSSTRAAQGGPSPSSSSSLDSSQSSSTTSSSSSSDTRKGWGFGK